MRYVYSSKYVKRGKGSRLVPDRLLFSCMDGSAIDQMLEIRGIARNMVIVTRGKAPF